MEQPTCPVQFHGGTVLHGRRSADAIHIRIFADTKVNEAMYAGLDSTRR